MGRPEPSPCRGMTQSESVGVHPEGWITLELAGKLGDEFGHLYRCWRLEQRAHGEIDAESFTKPRHCRRDDQGITAQLEEVVVWPDRVETENVGPC